MTGSCAGAGWGTLELAPKSTRFLVGPAVLCSLGGSLSCPQTPAHHPPRLSHTPRPRSHPAGQLGQEEASPPQEGSRTERLPSSPTGHPVPRARLCGAASPAACWPKCLTFTPKAARPPSEKVASVESPQVRRPPDTQSPLPRRAPRACGCHPLVLLPRSAARPRLPGAVRRPVW